MARRRDKGATKRSAEALDAADKDATPSSTVEVTEQIDSPTSPLRASGSELPSSREKPSSPPREVAASRTMNGGDIAESDSSDEVSDDSEFAVNGDGTGEGRSGGDGRDDEDDDDDESEEEILVVLELADFKNHPILDDYKAITIEGIGTPTPTLHIGEYSLHGQLEETVGTHYFYDTKNRSDDNEYRFAGQTTKKIRFTIAPPDDY